MYLNGPCEVANIDEERDVGAVAEVEVLVGEAVLELLDVAPGDDGDLLPGLGAGWRAERRREREREGGRMEKKKKEGGVREEMEQDVSSDDEAADLPVKLVAQVMFRLKFLEAFMNMSRSRLG